MGEPGERDRAATASPGHEKKVDAQEVEQIEMEKRRSYRLAARLLLYGLGLTVLFVMFMNLFAAVVSPPGHASYSGLSSWFGRHPSATRFDVGETDETGGPDHADMPVVSAEDNPVSTDKPDDGGPLRPIAATRNEGNDFALARAFDPDTGRLFTADVGSTEIRLCDIDSGDAPTLSWDAGHTIAAMERCVFKKRNALAVLVNNPSLLIFLDLNDGHPIERFDAPSQLLGLARASGSSAPEHRPYLTLVGPQHLCRFDLAQGHYGPLVPLPRAFNRIQDAFVFDRGSTLLFPGHPLVRQIRWPLDEINGQGIRSRMGSPRDIGTGVHNDIPTFTEPLGQTLASSTAFATDADTPIACSFDGYSLTIVSRNDGRLLRKIDVPANWLAKAAISKRIRSLPNTVRNQLAKWSSDSVHLFVDGLGDRLIVGFPHFAATFSLSHLDTRPDQLIQIGCMIPDVIDVDEELSIPIDIDPSGLNVVLESGPKGMKIQDNRICWSPTWHDVGDHQIELVTQSNGSPVKRRYQFHVERRSWTLPINVSGLKISRDAKWILARGTVAADGDDGHPARNTGATDCTLVAFDSNQQQIVGTRTFPKTIREFCVSDDAVFIRAGQFVGRLRLPDLRTEATLPLDSKQQLQSAVIRPIADRYVDLASSWDSNQPPLRLDASSLKPVPTKFVSPSHTNKYELGSSCFRLDGPCGFGFVVNGTLFDEQARRPKMLIWPSEFHETGKLRFQTGTHSPSDTAKLTGGQWHPFVFPDNPQHMANRQSATGLATNQSALPSDPVLATARFNRDDLMLTFSNAISRKEAETLRLFTLASDVESRSQSIQTQGSRSLRVAAGNRHVAVTAGRKLFVHPVRDEIVQLNTPLYIEPIQSRLVLPAEGEADLSYVANRPCRWAIRPAANSNASFTREQPWIRSDDGSLKLNMGTFVDRWIEEWLHTTGIIHVSHKNPQHVQALSDVLRRQRDRFAKLVGSEPSGTPITARVEVVAETNDFEIFRIEHDYLIDVPDQMIENVMRMHTSIPMPLDRLKPKRPGTNDEPRSRVFDT